MKKTVLAFAVAAAMGVPAVAAADTTLYGRFNVSLDAVDNDVDSSTQLASNGSRIGVRGSEDLGGGLRGVFQMEAGFDATQGTGDLASRNTFVGLAGDFGEVRLGRHDTPYKISTLRLNYFADMLGDMHNLAGSAAAESNASRAFYVRPNNTIIYMTPSFDGFQAMASYTTDTRGEGDQPGEGSGDRDGYSLAVTFSSGPMYLTGAYETWNNWADGDEDPSAFKFGINYSFGDLSVAGLYENVDAGGAVGDRDVFHLGARYSMGQTTLMASYTHASDDDRADTSADMFALGASYSFSRRTNAYVSYAMVSNDDAASYGFNGTGKGKGVAAGEPGADVSGFQVGVAHNF